jgi:4-carboxymuconolactone decarboxylase
MNRLPLAGLLLSALASALTMAHAATADRVAQLAFYAGWPNVFSALPVVKDVFEKRTG